MKYINLIDKLSDMDKQKIANYIYEYGINKNDFIGLEKWLEPWSHAKQTLYQLLGNNLMVEIPFQYEKPEHEIKGEFFELLNYKGFKFTGRFRDNLWKLKNDGVFDFVTYNILDSILSSHILSKNKLELKNPIKYKDPTKNNTLQLQSGIKPMKAISSIMKYFDKMEWGPKDFEEFRIAHSLILNDRVLKGFLVLSIFPLDFMTMSDNASNWSSCMSWSQNGCYHQGTVEMMNSNNVLCCYFKTSKDDDYHFCKDNEDEAHSWNNKKWRTLAYVTKDIIMSGKAYPYRNEDLSKRIVSEIQDLALKNKGWNYAFDLEPYRDMIHINNNNQMDYNRNWIRYGNANKHNIIFDTKGMYNDMLNDHRQSYWCVRNKVRSNKIISVSGKSVCLRCGQPVIEVNHDMDWENDYNERFINAGRTCCEECYSDPDYYCDECGGVHPTRIHYSVKTDKSYAPIHVCEDCYKTHARYCPCCGKPFWAHRAIIPGVLNDNINKDELNTHFPLCFYIDDEIEDRGKNLDRICFFKVYVCPDCEKKVTQTAKKIKYKYETFTIIQPDLLKEKIGIGIEDLKCINLKRVPLPASPDEVKILY